MTTNRDVPSSSSSEMEAHQDKTSSEMQHHQCKYQLKIDIIYEKKELDLPCIYKVPKRVREIKPAAYTPQLVPIGPLYRNHQNSDDSPVLAMEAPKQRYLEEFLKKADKTKEDLLKIIEDNEENIRRCYEETIELCSVCLANMILLDSAFIFELFLWENTNGGNDFLIGNPWLRNAMILDLILLENQLPYFILKELYDAAGLNNKYDKLYTLMGDFFQSQIGNPGDEYLNESKKCTCDCCFNLLFCFCCCPRRQNVETLVDCHIPPVRKKYEPKHFTDFVRANLMPGQSQDCEVSGSATQNGKVSRGVPATKLAKAGVIFKATKDCWPIGVKFDKGELTMPLFKVDDSTEGLFRNLMAFEQRHYPKQTYISNYVTFLNSLIDSEEDVDFLIEKHVIVNDLGDNKSLADLVNKLDKETLVIDFRYSNICVALEEHYENCWFGCVSYMRQIYFTNVWKGTGTVAAFMILVLTLITSINSVIQIVAKL